MWMRNGSFSDFSFGKTMHYARQHRKLYHDVWYRRQRNLPEKRKHHQQLTFTERCAMRYMITSSLTTPWRHPKIVRRSLGGEREIVYGPDRMCWNLKKNLNTLGGSSEILGERSEPGLQHLKPIRILDIRTISVYYYAQNRVLQSSTGVEQEREREIVQTIRPDVPFFVTIIAFSCSKYCSIWRNQLLSG